MLSYSTPFVVFHHPYFFLSSSILKEAFTLSAGASRQAVVTGAVPSRPAAPLHVSSFLLHRRLSTLRLLYDSHCFPPPPGTRTLALLATQQPPETNLGVSIHQPKVCRTQARPLARMPNVTSRFIFIAPRPCPLASTALRAWPRQRSWQWCWWLMPVAIT